MWLDCVVEVLCGVCVLGLEGMCVILCEVLFGGYVSFWLM